MASALSLKGRNQNFLHIEMRLQKLVAIYIQMYRKWDTEKGEK